MEFESLDLSRTFVIDFGVEPFRMLLFFPRPFLTFFALWPLTA